MRVFVQVFHVGTLYLQNLTAGVECHSAQLSFVNLTLARALLNAQRRPLFHILLSKILALPIDGPTVCVDLNLRGRSTRSKKAKYSMGSGISSS